MDAAIANQRKTFYVMVAHWTWKSIEVVFMENFVQYIRNFVSRGLSYQFPRFVIVGTMAFIIDASLLRVFTTLGFDPYTGRAMSVPPAMLFGFIMNRRFTFRDDGNQKKRVQLPKYAAVQGVGALINYSIFALLVAFVPLISVYLELGVAAGAIGAMMWNFLMARTLVFSDRRILGQKSQ